MGERFPVEEGQALLRRFWPAIVKQVPADELPSAPDAPQLGCGAYGCVWGLGRPDLVAKLTTDQAEVAFVGAALTLPPNPGIVRYTRALQLGGAMVRSRQVFMLWRQRVAYVGLPVEDRLSNSLLSSFKGFAQDVREAMRLLPHEDAARVFPLWGSLDAGGRDRSFEVEHAAQSLAEAWGIAQDMQATQQLGLVGDALQAFMREGILLADVHHGNVGTLGEGPPFVITDPGQAVFLDRRWSKITIPLLPEKRGKDTSDLDQIMETITERVRYMGHNAYSTTTAKKTGPSSFRVDHVVSGRVDGRLDVKVTPKLVTVEAASTDYGGSRVIFEEAFYSLAGGDRFGGRQIRVKHVDLGAAVWQNPS